MSIEDSFPGATALAGGAGDFEAIAKIYLRAAEAMGAFAQAGGLTCPAGCGSCCERFIPDLLPIEAEWMAAWLIHHDPARALELALIGFGTHEREAATCPFFAASGPLHCGIYGGRGLLCRLFGYSALPDKEGRVAFALCAHMPSRASEARQWKGADIEGEFGALPPLMTDFAAELDALRPTEGQARRLLFDALPDALRRQYLRMNYGALAIDDDSGAVKAEAVLVLTARSADPRLDEGPELPLV